MKLLEGSCISFWTIIVPVAHLNLINEIFNVDHFLLYKYFQNECFKAGRLTFIKITEQPRSILQADVSQPHHFKQSTVNSQVNNGKYDYVKQIRIVFKECILSLCPVLACSSFLHRHAVAYSSFLHRHAMKRRINWLNKSGLVQDKHSRARYCGLSRGTGWWWESAGG